MDNPILGIDKIHQSSIIREKPKKQKLLVVDDEPDNLDLLYRTFRRDFNVLKADSGISALEVLATEGEVAVIISDQRMPEMKGTEFLSKTVPQFPDTIRIILTGFTDIEDLVEAINAGQVYKYITKPWDPTELKAVVQRAAETYDLLKQRTEELNRSNAQMGFLATLLQLMQMPSSTEAALNPIAKIFGENFAADGCILQMIQQNKLDSLQGIYSNNGSMANCLSEDPLIDQAIASGKIQVVNNISLNENLANISHYSTHGIKAHLAIPIIYQEKTLAILSLQWKQPTILREDELRLIESSVQVAAISLAAIRCCEKGI
ncbi:response regulator [Calothrix sp. PCC 6303]|uniref:response regulator n=1 Tax=Calothrix sp. PCC 6303 TaxID=1170562 RepID=UPI0002A00F70|nr:response regulator [Calothrix sp. PCC 6303]AFZ02595.1 response regulator receiver modulated GAF sensor protein [Calothrix sp. PCC 6303]